MLLHCKPQPNIEVEETSEKPNIILIYMDDMGYGDLASYGHPLIKTPEIDKMAAEGLRFTSFYAPASVCTPSRAGLLTGRYPVRNAPLNFGPESKDGLPLSEVTLADVLRDEGYATAAIGKWHLGHRPEYLPTSRGFDYWYGLPYSNDMILPWCPWLTEEDKLYLYEDQEIIREVGKNQNDLMLDYSDKAIEFIQNTDAPFFLYLAHNMPHLPISAPDRFKGQSLAGLYGDVIETVDWTIGEIINTLEERDIDDQTLVIFTSDNGPWHNLPDRMLQEGVEKWHTGSTGIFRGAKMTTYEGGYRVPAIMYWPGSIEAGRVNNDIVSAIDLFPTIVELCGADYQSTDKIDGLDISELVLNGQPSVRSRFIYTKLKTVEAIRKNDWKLRVTADEGVQLFNLYDDPAEKYNRAYENKEMAEVLWKEMAEFAEETNTTIIALEP